MNFIPKVHYSMGQKSFFKPKQNVNSCYNQIITNFMHSFCYIPWKLRNWKIYTNEKISWNWFHFIWGVFFLIFIFWLIVKIWWMFFRITPSFAWHFWWNMNGHLKLFFFVKIICIWKCKQKADEEFFYLFFRIVRIPSCRNPWCSQCFAWYSAWRSFKGMLRICYVFSFFLGKFFSWKTGI